MTSAPPTPADRRDHQEPAVLANETDTQPTPLSKKTDVRRRQLTIRKW